VGVVGLSVALWEGLVAWEARVYLVVGAVREEIVEALWEALAEGDWEVLVVVVWEGVLAASGEDCLVSAQEASDLEVWESQVSVRWVWGAPGRWRGPGSMRG